MQTKKNNWKAIVLLLSVVTSLSFRYAVHPFYISVCEIELKSKEKSLHLSCRMFTDDIQRELSALHQKRLNLSHVDAENKKLLSAYILDHVKIKVGGRQVQLNCIGYELEEEAVWCYFEGPVTKPDLQVQIENTLLCSALEGETNIVHCTLDGKRKSQRLLCPDKILNFNFGE